MDIERSLALPASMPVHFRYDRRWIAPAITSSLDSTSERTALLGASALIAYLDQSDSGKLPEVVPCRFARVLSAVPLGQTVSLELAVEDFAFAEDLATFNSELRRTASKLPRWTSGVLDGEYWTQLERTPDVARSGETAMWEQVIGQLAGRSDFASSRLFYTVAGLTDTGSDLNVVARDATFDLRPDRDYELRLYHFHPSEDAAGSLRLDATGVPISFAMTPDVPLDSRHDLKRIRFRTSSPPTTERGVLTLWRRVEPSAEWTWDVDLPVRVRRTLARRVALSLVIGAFLAVTPITTAYADDPKTIAVVGVGASLLAAFTAAFGLRTSL
jgi:hypothetical protein